MENKPKSNKEIIDDFLARHDRERFALKKKKADLYARIPALANLDAEIDLAGVAYTRARISGDPQAKAIFDATVAELDCQKKAILTDNGIPEDYLTPHYHCKQCQDTGYVDGRMCSCLHRLLSEASFSRYDLKPQARHENFDTFSLAVYPEAYTDHYRGIHQVFKAYCSDFKAVSENYLFTGKPGLGKTFLSNCIVNALIQQDYDIIYITAGHLVKLVQENMHDPTASVQELYQALLACDLIIIDDLGAEYATAFSGSQLFDIINTRILGGGPMIISTNLTPKQIFTQYDERLSSRIRGNFKTVPFYGDDIRLIKKRQQS
ncbi:ATP-binding protein [Eubacterium barkeri]|uniref:DNA replication protein DnaC n=1 Tax=Eubacterium barkeri TaxID=1528 RepID=A0A1H3F5F4_EUBBA|nr:ATP-binding protein [Eubacterium barkeri]SDX86211.1 DNA replication protein DnaC [Eubacterium barkeri]